MAHFTDDNGQAVTHINVSRVFTYDVDAVVRQIMEDNRGEIEVSLDDVFEYISNAAQDDFDSPVTHLFFTDNNGGEY